MARNRRTPTVDLDLLRPALQRLAVFAAVGAILFGTSSYYGGTAQEQRKAQEDRLSDERRAYYRSRQAREMLQSFSGQYQYWRERGVIGDEQRLQWLEALQNATSALRLAEVNYSISPQTVARDLPVEVPGRVHRSEMTLSMRLVHERDLLDLTAMLERHTRGLFWVRQCELGREGNLDTPQLGDGINAQCQLDWLTVAEESGPEEQGDD